MNQTRRPVLLVATTTDSVATGLILPVLPFIALQFGIGAVAIGTLAAAFSLAQLAAATLWGTLSDRFGIRPLLIAAPLVSTGGHLLFAFAHGYPLLLAGRTVAGFGAAVVLLVQIHITATTSTQDRTGLLGQVTAMQGLANIFGPTIGGLLAPHGTMAVGLTSAAMTIVTATIAAAGLPSVRREPRAEAKRSPWQGVTTVVRVRALRHLGLAMLVTWFCFAGYSTILPLRLEHHLDMTVTEYGLLGTISGAFALVIRGLLLKRLVRHFGELGLMATGAGLLAASMTLAPLLPGLGFTPILPVTWATGASLLFPSMVGQLSKAAPAGSAGLVLGGGSMLVSTGLILGPVAAGTGLQVAGGAIPFFVGAAVFAVVATASIRLRRTPAPGTEVPAPGVPAEADPASVTATD